MTNVFVTGGSGFIGGRLIERLVSDGHKVRALARSDVAEAKVAAHGAEPALGDLSDVDSLIAGCRDAEWVFHSAAWTGPGGTWDDFIRDNVDGTSNVIAAARAARVQRLVHVGTEAAIMAGQPLRDADETVPLQPDSPAPYPATKARAEALVLAANNGLETVVIRPRFVWGAGDTTILPGLVEAVRAGRFAWIGGKHRTDITHVDNTVEGLILGAQRGKPGEAYFVTDGEPVVFREFVTELLATQGVAAPTKSMPYYLANLVASGVERLWALMRRPELPPINKFLVWAAGQECTINIGKARTELGYQPVRSRDEGLRQLRTLSE